MIGIVPLAGPEVYHPIHGTRPLTSFDGEPLLRRALTSRRWWRQRDMRPEDLIFVLRGGPETNELGDRLDEWFPGSRQIRVSQLTTGALLTCLAGTSLIEDLERPICLDLVDIIYDCDADLAHMFDDPNLGGVIPWFESEESCYSYLALNDAGDVVRTAEKQVISNIASAGTYIFRDLPTFLEATAYALRHANQLAVDGTHFVCPAMNGVIAQGLRVRPLKVRNIISVSKQFHDPRAIPV